MNTEAKQSINGSNGASFGDHDVLEGDHIPSLMSYGQALEEVVVSPMFSVMVVMQRDRRYKLSYQCALLTGKFVIKAQ